MILKYHLAHWRPPLHLSKVYNFLKIKSHVISPPQLFLEIFHKIFSHFFHLIVRNVIFFLICLFGLFSTILQVTSHPITRSFFLNCFPFCLALKQLLPLSHTMVLFIIQHVNTFYQLLICNFAVSLLWQLICWRSIQFSFPQFLYLSRWRLLFLMTKYLSPK